MSGSCWTPQAVEAVARAILGADPAVDVDSLMARLVSAPFVPDRVAAIEKVEVAIAQARAALAAVEPYAREAFAREVEAMTAHYGGRPTGQQIAAALRAGVPAPEPWREVARREGRETAAALLRDDPLAATMCPECAGTGRAAVPRARAGSCPTCNGSGEVSRVPAPELCERCDGTGERLPLRVNLPAIADLTCPDCNGTGRRVPAPEPTTEDET